MLPNQSEKTAKNDQLSSNTAAHFTRSEVAADNGFRCCADAVFF